MKTVAAISFNDNHSLSIDVEAVESINISRAQKVDDGEWFCELVIDSHHGKIALQLLADDPARFKILDPTDAGGDGPF